MRGLYLLALVITLALILAACGGDTESTGGDGDTSSSESGDSSSEGSSEESDEPKQGGDLVLASTGSPTMFNPLYTSDTTSGVVEDMIYNGLTGTAPDGEKTPDLATEWEHNDDGTVLTFYLRDDVTWHDGEPFTAEDVEFTYSLPLSEDYTGPRATYFKSVEKVEAIDDYTVEITLKSPDATFLTKSTGYGVLPKHILGDVPIADIAKHEFNTKNPIGTGPFKFVEWKQGQHVLVEANEDYFEGRPNFDTITQKIVDDSNAMLAQFQAGDIDFIGVPSDNLSSAEALVERGQAEMETVLRTSYTYIGYNHRIPMFEDKKVRQALTHAIDRETFLESVMDGNGQVINHPGYPEGWAYNDDVPEFEYDPEKAKELLAEAGWTDTNDEGILVNEDGEEFEFTLKLQQGNTVRTKVAEYAQEEWGKLGIKVNLNVSEWSAFLQELDAPHDFDAFILGLSASLDPSVTSVYHSSEAENGLNRAGYSNKELDKLMEESDHIADQDERAEKIKEIQGIIAEDQPFTYMFLSTNNYIFKPELKGIQMHPTSSYYKINEWWFDE